NDLNCLMSSAKELNTSPSSLTVFPNPSQGHCTLSLPKQSFDYLVLNHLGQLIEQQKNCYHQSTLNTRAYANGLYIIQVRTKDQEIFSQKLHISN
ncbi:MAG: Unknown protein, partial [uncultured Aureispira sp.]